MAVGYQGSDKSGCEVSFYGHGSDPVLPGAIRGAANLRAVTKSFSQVGDGLAGALAASAISSLSWSKSIGQAAGTFSMDIRTHSPETFLEGLMDDDWVDIVLMQHDSRFHTCRGLIDTVRDSSTLQNGASVGSVTITGRDFGKIFDVTPVFFNLYLGKDVGGGATLARLSSNGALWGNVAKTVQGFLFAFLQAAGQEHANARWALPPGIPGLTDGSKRTTFFRDKVITVDSLYSNWPERVAFHPHLIDPEYWGGHTLWDLAKEWADPFFCELFVDLVDSVTLLPPKDGEELLPANSLMGLVIRDKPFPTANARSNGKPITLAEHPWFNTIPTYTVRLQELGQPNVGRGGEERYNAFFVKNAATNEYGGQRVNIVKPLWYPEDVARRGLRRMEANSNYHEASSNNDGMVTAQKEQLRDWYGLNAYYWNGTLQLNRLRPDIRIGTKVRVPGASPEEGRTYYVEGVSHQWSLGQGRTTLTVTRGWKGSDQQLMDAITALSDRYVVPSLFPDDNTFDPSTVIA